MRLTALLLLAAASTTAFAAVAPDARLGDSYRFNQLGWTYVHLYGTPEQIGFQHGYLLAHEIEDNVHVFQVENKNVRQAAWSFFRDAGRTVLWPHLDAGVSGGAEGHCRGSACAGVEARPVGCCGDEWRPRADGLLSAGLMQEQAHKPIPPAAVAPGKCSAFIATGSATKDGKIVIAHSNWSSYAEGERWTMVFDIVPASGQHLLHGRCRRASSPARTTLA